MLFESELDAFGLLGLARFADNSLETALALRNRLAEAELGFLQRHDATLKDFAIETTNDVFVCLALIFTCNFDSHTEIDYSTDAKEWQEDYRC